MRKTPYIRNAHLSEALRQNAARALLESPRLFSSSVIADLCELRAGVVNDLRKEIIQERAKAKAQVKA